MDHHYPQGEYGDLAYVETVRESCAGLIAKFLIEKRFKLNDAAATALFIGMVTDSGRFRYSSTNSETYKIASELMKYKIDTEYIYNKIYMDKLSNVKLKAKLIEKIAELVKDKRIEGISDIEYAGLLMKVRISSKIRHYTK